MSSACESNETQIKLQEHKETGLKLIVKAEKIHPDRKAFQVQGMLLICNGKETQIKVCEGAKRQGTIEHCEVQREWEVAMKSKEA